MPVKFNQMENIRLQFIPSMMLQLTLDNYNIVIWIYESSDGCKFTVLGLVVFQIYFCVKNDTKLIYPPKVCL